eukprot:766802-Hanusia_phi.AAC.3
MVELGTSRLHWEFGPDPGPGGPAATGYAGQAAGPGARSRIAPFGRNDSRPGWEAHWQPGLSGVTLSRPPRPSGPATESECGKLRGPPAPAPHIEQ